MNKPFYLFPLSLIWPPNRTVYFEILNIFLLLRFPLSYLTSTYLFTILFISLRSRCSNSYLNSTHSIPLVTLYICVCCSSLRYFWTYKPFKQVPCKDQVETFLAHDRPTASMLLGWNYSSHDNFFYYNPFHYTLYIVKLLQIKLSSLCAERCITWCLPAAKITCM